MTAVRILSVSARNTPSGRDPKFVRTPCVFVLGENLGVWSHDTCTAALISSDSFTLSRQSICLTVWRIKGNMLSWDLPWHKHTVLSPPVPSHGGTVWLCQLAPSVATSAVSAQVNTDVKHDDVLRSNRAVLDAERYGRAGDQQFASTQSCRHDTSG